MNSFILSYLILLIFCLVFFGIEMKRFMIDGFNCVILIFELAISGGRQGGIISLKVFNVFVNDMFLVLSGVNQGAV